MIILTNQSQLIIAKTKIVLIIEFLVRSLQLKTCCFVQLLQFLSIDVNDFDPELEAESRQAIIFNLVIFLVT